MTQRIRFLFLAAILTGGSASAYILPAWSILRRMSEARDELQISNFRLDGTLTLSSWSGRGLGTALVGSSRSELQVDALLLMKLPGRCRLEASALEGGRSIAIWSGVGSKPSTYSTRRLSSGHGGLVMRRGLTVV